MVSVLKLSLLSAASMSFFQQDAVDVKDKDKKKTLEVFFPIVDASAASGAGDRVYYDEIPAGVQFTR